ncbi:8-oxoguanine DNA glycosylase [Candidatus Woesearchaeota archaeon]|nr:8-oxoguanine DNA glycosylase [Candidatus Woesearchaeota archaeon]
MHIKVKDFNLKHSIESGQIFNFEQKDEGYLVKHSDKAFFVKQEGNNLFYEGNKDFITNFFGLNEDFSKIQAHLKKDPLTKKALKKYPGLRLLHQDLWECLISFVCSSASNIPKIKKNIKLLSENFGEKKNGTCLFPKPGKINNLQTIKDCATGFRAKYIYEINKIVNEDWLEKVKKADYSKAKEMLIELPGVGEKIADCVCLFALGHHQSFPIDVWIKRVIEENYLKKQSNYKEIKEFAQKHFNPYSGYSQQYLYQWRRLL